MTIPSECMSWETTFRICEVLGITRNRLTGLRRRYRDRIPTPQRVGNALVWPPRTKDILGELLRLESGIRPGAEREAQP